MELVDGLKENTDTDQFLVAMILAWKAWDKRNKEYKGQASLTPHDLVDWCKNYLAIFRSAQIHKFSPQRHVHMSTWHPPPVGAVKINTDAAVSSGNLFFSVGMVARNDEGQCIWWRVIKLPGNLHPAECEATAALKELLLAREKGWTNVVVEGDNLQVITALQHGENDLSSFSLLLDECLRLSLDIEYCSFNFVKRTGNLLAHAIAHFDCNFLSEGLVLPSILGG
ncbi:PREDICTED: uncharacterized protein LOC105962666 [Erythranthe guttata]|uniref:uncharacterized protein LOC105962666 n=1 Tax=Erythranthe guttata TaxID=4155 RepID=UPI00064D8457|nr:PREDICTED: uncharacterized protein LOC105962666 [Erythranthe guttata]|eukprot:XP_012842432.1 PREDICTED: uncharacterized protein LOC105962666 [Erythranthe guttata]